MSRVILMMATLACAIITPAAGALLLLPSSVFAQQEETSLGEGNMADRVVSNVLGGSDDDIDDEDENDSPADDAVIFGDNRNAQTAVPIIDQDQDSEQRAANLAEQLGF